MTLHFTHIICDFKVHDSNLHRKRDSVYSALLICTTFTWLSNKSKWNWKFITKFFSCGNSQLTAPTSLWKYDINNNYFAHYLLRLKFLNTHQLFERYRIRMRTKFVWKYSKQLNTLRGQTRSAERWIQVSNDQKYIFIFYCELEIRSVIFLKSNSFEN